MDAIIRVKSLTEAVVEEGGVVLAVSLDIANAFNTLPWDRVGGAVNHHQCPPYLARLVRDYFRDRAVEFVDGLGRPSGRELSCGVPQGSVLGPLMWNLVYDEILRTALHPGCGAVC